jgi:hypothetical protein
MHCILFCFYPERPAVPFHHVETGQVPDVRVRLVGPPDRLVHGALVHTDHPRLHAVHVDQDSRAIFHGGDAHISSIKHQRSPG